MNKYTVHTIEDDGDFFFALFENNTHQVIDFFYFQEDAMKCSQFMENGGAFDGFTPSFILRTIKDPTEINQKFTSLLSE